MLKSKPSVRLVQTFSGHRNARTLIKECGFWGNKYVMSGSDCGHVFFWDKASADIVNVVEADKHVVNCVQENPNFPGEIPTVYNFLLKKIKLIQFFGKKTVLATSGIDYDIKIWQPTAENFVQDMERIEKVTSRNKLMINESKNIIYIPVQFMMPALRICKISFI